MQLPRSEPPNTEPDKATTETEPEEEGPGPQFQGYMGEPVLVAGDGGDAVAELCAKLAAAGFETAVSKGEAHAELTNDVYDAVERFREEHGVEDELAKGDKAVIGPATWAALNYEAGY